MEHGCGDASNEGSLLELTRLTIAETFVYRLPSYRHANGHRAEEWGLEKPAMTGVLKVVERQSVLFLRIFSVPESSTEQELFCEAPIRISADSRLANFVESVADSSRYFVIRIEESSSGKHAFIGFGFRERQAAFDFKAALQDFERSEDRSRLAESLKEQVRGDEDNLRSEELRRAQADMSGCGTKVRINLPGTSSRKPISELSRVSRSGSCLLPLPPPPPSANSSASSSPSARNKGGPSPEFSSEKECAAVCEPTSENDNEWTDFTSTPAT